MEDNGVISAYIYMFGAWLTHRSQESGPFSATLDSAPMAELVDQYIKGRGLGEPDFEAVNGELRYKKHPKILEKQMEQYLIKPMTIEELKDHYRVEDPK